MVILLIILFVSASRDHEGRSQTCVEAAYLTESRFAHRIWVNADNCSF